MNQVQCFLCRGLAEKEISGFSLLMGTNYPTKTYHIVWQLIYLLHLHLCYRDSSFLASMKLALNCYRICTLETEMNSVPALEVHLCCNGEGVRSCSCKDQRGSINNLTRMCSASNCCYHRSYSCAGNSLYESCRSETETMAESKSGNSLCLYSSKELLVLTCFCFVCF